MGAVDSGIHPTAKYQTTSQISLYQPTRSEISNAHERNEDTGKPKVSKSLEITTRPSVDTGLNDKYAYAPVGPLILNTINFFSQNLSSVLKITKNNYNNNKITIILQIKRQHYIKYLQPEPEPQPLPSNSYLVHWIYIVIEMVLLFLLVQFIDIAIHQNSETLSYYNKTVLKIIQDHHTSCSIISPESTASISFLHLQYRF